MAPQHFGSRLAEARRRRGLTLEQVHKQLRITPGILEAIELADFRHMPFKGHARNMVSAYARYLGLNPEDVTKQFLKEHHDYENREARQSSSPYASLGLDPSSHDFVTDSMRMSNSENSRSTRSIWDRPIPNSELSQGYKSRPSTARRMTTPQAGSRARVAEGSVSNRYGAGSYKSRPSLPMRIFGTLFKSPVVAVIVLIVLLVSLLVLWAMVANSCKQQENEVIPINTGSVVDDGTAVDTEGVPVADEDGEVNPRYGPFELSIEPAPGAAPWVEVTVDGGDVFSTILESKQTWQVTVDCAILTAQPHNLIVTRNGEEVTLDIDSATGMAYTTLEVIERPASQG